MSEYLLINLLIIIIPLVFSFDKKVRFYKKIPPVFISIITVGLIFIVWDSIAEKRGDWSFNPEFISGIYIFNLPVDEILFFITVPYACIFIYETLRFYIPEKIFQIKKSFFLFPGLILTGTGIIFHNQNYTFTVLIFAGFFFLSAILILPEILNSKTFWYTILITYLPFLIVNYFLTSLPVVSYNSTAIWGIRFITIPLEDFLYSFSLISFWLLAYKKSGKVLAK